MSEGATRGEMVATSRRGGRAEVFAWAMYDWANSAYSTISITMLVAYIQKVVLPGRWGPVAWAWGIAGSMLTAAVLSPWLGALADANASKRSWLARTALAGAASAVLLALAPPEWTWLVLAMFFITSLMFELSLGFYNAFLPEIADERTMGMVSAWGFALGYLGGALALIGGVLVIRFGPRLCLPDLPGQLRAGIVIMGAWWGLFSLPALIVLRDRAALPAQRVPALAAARRAADQVGRTVRNVRAYRMAALFLLGFLFYNDGVQTVISQSPTLAIQDLKFTADELIGVILMIQFVAIPGAMVVGWVADHWLDQKPTLVLCLAIWVVLLIAAFFITQKWHFWALGAVVALVLGGTQSVSRAIMGLMTPAKHTAEFFGFFNLTGKATGFLGTFVFGLIAALTPGSARLGILSLLTLFAVGWVLVAMVDVAEGRRQAMHENSELGRRKAENGKRKAEGGTDGPID